MAKRRPDFALPAGTKVLTTRLPDRLPCPPIQAGNLLAAFVVEGQPVPWSPSRITRRGNYRDPRLTAWQRTIARVARETWGNSHQPYGGPVELRLKFFYRRRGGNARVADTTNLQKAAEDAIQGIVIVNDSQVCVIRSERFYTDPYRVHVEVYAL